MKQAVWAEEMLVSVVASVSGLKVQWLVVAMEVWWSGRACLHSHLFHATERRSRPKVGSLGRGRAPVSSQFQHPEGPAMSYQTDIEVIHLILPSVKIMTRNHLPQ